MNLGFYVPTRIIMGSGVVMASWTHLRPLGSKALIITGRSSARINGSLADVTVSLEKAGVSWQLFDQVESNPGIPTCRRAADAARYFQADFLVGIGGGSPLDAAKAVAILARNDLADDQLFSGPYPMGALPVVAVPTTAGTGSEVTQFAILTNDRIRSKSSIFWDGVFPVLALLDPGYLAFLPRDQKINTALDALSHVVEGYLAKRADPLSRSLALEAMGPICQGVRALAAGEPDRECSEGLLYGACVGGMVIAHTMTTIVHGMGYFLTYEKGIDHGRANGLLLGDYLGFIGEADPRGVERVLEACGCRNVGDFKALLDSVLGTRETLSQAEMEDFSLRSLQSRHGANTARQVDHHTVLELYASSLGTKE